LGAFSLISKTSLISVNDCLLPRFKLTTEQNTFQHPSGKNEKFDDE
jgi:hypothetical protein